MIKRGDIYYADLSGSIGSEQGGVRPVVIVQNDIGNRYSPTIVCVSITSQLGKKQLPTHVLIKQGDGGLEKESIVMTEQVRTIDKSRLMCKSGSLRYKDMLKINIAILVSFGLFSFTNYSNKGTNNIGTELHQELYLQRMA